jgi:TonB family protein
MRHALPGTGVPFSLPIKAWPLAVAGSLAVHVTVVAWSLESPEVAPLAVSKATRVSLWSRPQSSAVPAASASVVARRTKPSRPKAAVVEVGPAVTASPVLVEGGGEEVVSSEGQAEISSGSEGESLQAQPEVDVGALVHAQLLAAADRCYPSASRRFRQRGVVELSFCLDALGAPVSSQVTHSSGAPLLDAAARGCVVHEAGRFPAVAASQCFAVPVRFGNSDGQ